MRHRETRSTLIYFMDYAIAQTVILYRAFRDFIYLCSLFFVFFFYERKGVACSHVAHNKLAYVACCTCICNVQ